MSGEVQSNESSQLSISVDDGIVSEGTVFKAIRQGKGSALSLENLHKNLIQRFKNIQAMFDSLSSIYIAKSEDVSLNHALQVVDNCISVKASKIDLDGDIDHNAKTYFGISKDSDLDIYSYRDADEATIGSFHTLVKPNGTIEVSLTNNNPQPGTEDKLTSSLVLTTNKEGEAWLSWNGAKLISSISNLASNAGIKVGTAGETIGKSSSREVTVKFNTEITSYTLPPVVTITPLCKADYASDIFVVLTSITETQFKATVKNANASKDVDVTLQWSAFPAPGDNLQFS